MRFQIASGVSLTPTAAWFGMGLVAASSVGAQPVITSLGVAPGKTESRAYAISADGRAVTGESSLDGRAARQAMRWSREAGMVGLDEAPRHSSGTALNADGGVVVGWFQGTSGRSSGFRWTAKEGVVDLGRLPTSLDAVALDVSDDGSVVVGASGWRAFRWTPGTGMVDMGQIPGESGLHEASGVSADGSVIVGTSGRKAFRWTAASGMEDLGSLPGSFGMVATGVSGDGETVIGAATVSPSGRPFRWTRASGVEEIVVEGDPRLLELHDVDHDGSIIVGSLWREGETRVGAIWTEATGAVELQPYLASLGCDLSGWSVGTAWGVSADGHRIVGEGFYNGEARAWLVTLGPVCRADFNGDARVDSQDFFAFLAAFFVSDPIADFNSDGGVDSQDFFSFLSEFFSPC
jgi:probable HAF family extracellular repeat protein